MPLLQPSFVISKLIVLYWQLKASQLRHEECAEQGQEHFKAAVSFLGNIRHRRFNS